MVWSRAMRAAEALYKTREGIVPPRQPLFSCSFPRGPPGITRQKRSPKIGRAWRGTVATGQTPSRKPPAAVDAITSLREGRTVQP